MCFPLLNEHQEARGQCLEKVMGTYSKDQGGISTNACRVYLQSRGQTPGCSVGGGVYVSVLIHPTPQTQGVGQHAMRENRRLFL